MLASGLSTTHGSPNQSAARAGERQTAQVTYTNVVITDTTNNVMGPVAGTFDSGCLLPNVRGA